MSNGPIDLGRAAGVAALGAVLLTSLTTTGCQSGISKEEHCSSPRALVSTVSAARGSSGVPVSWRDIYAVHEPLTYRVYSRPSASADWARITDLDLEPTAQREHVDPSPPATPLEYAVTVIGECGESPICTRTNVGEVCSVASVGPASKQR